MYDFNDVNKPIGSWNNLDILTLPSLIGKSSGFVMQKSDRRHYSSLTDTIVSLDPAVGCAQPDPWGSGGFHSSPCSRLPVCVQPMWRHVCSYGKSGRGGEGVGVLQKKPHSHNQRSGMVVLAQSSGSFPYLLFPKREREKERKANVFLRYNWQPLFT